jgi:murein DD-endopeptidase MepM/ murein hydrolase activator NlpD
LGQISRRSQATPNPKRILQRQIRLLSLGTVAFGARVRHLSFVALDGTSSYLAGLIGVRGLRLALNTSVAVLVLSLPFAATAASRASTVLPTSPAGTTVITASTTDASRAQTLARGGTIAASRNPMTVAAEGTRPVQEVTIHEGDTLATMANYYDVSVEAIAFANSLSDAHALQLGQKLVIPPAEGALYKVKDGDTVEAIASHFKVDPSVILSYNRCTFEPEQCAAGQQIFVRGAELPALVEPERPARDVFAAAPQVAQQARNGRLSWPVGGIITQYFWWGHTGVDVAAPYGTGLGAGDDGVVTATGWVPVGGLRVCVQHAGDLTVCYYHTSAVYVSVGQQVARGQIIAAIGLTGVTTGPHVHWECKVGNQFVSCLSL